MGKEGWNIYVHSDTKQRFKQEFENPSREIERYLKERLKATASIEARIEDLEEDIEDQKEVIEEEKQELQALESQKQSLLDLQEAREQQEDDTQDGLNHAVSVLKRTRQESNKSWSEMRDERATRYWANELDMTPNELVEECKSSDVEAAEVRTA